MGSKQRWLIVSLLCLGMVSIPMKAKGSIHQDPSIEIARLDEKHNWISGQKGDGETAVYWDAMAYYYIEIAIANMQEKSLELQQINLSVYEVDYSNRFVRWKVITDELPIILKHNQYCTFICEAGSGGYTFQDICVKIDEEWFEFSFYDLKYLWPTQWSNIYHYTHTSIVTLPTIILGLILGGWIVRRRRKNRKGDLQT